MIPADHRKWAEYLFAPYLNRLCRRHFHSIRLLGQVPGLSKNRPLLLLPNHSTWWDGFFVFLLNRHVLGRKTYLMMLEEQLRINGFFRFLGAYSIDPGSFSGVRRSLLYTSALLSPADNPPLVCFFPQGELLPLHQRPVRFGKGLDFILSRVSGHIDLAFLGIWSGFLQDQRPDVFLQVSPVMTVTRHTRPGSAELALSLEQFLGTMEQAILQGAQGQVLIRGGASINQRFRSKKKRRDSL